MGPYCTSHIKNLQVITNFLAWYLLFFKKSWFQSGLDFWKSGLEGSNGKNHICCKILLSFRNESGLIFFDLTPPSLRNGFKGQNQGHSSRTFIYELLVDFSGQQAGFWYYLPPYKVSCIFKACKCPKWLVFGLLTKRTHLFSSLFSPSSLHFLHLKTKILEFFSWFRLSQQIPTAESDFLQHFIMKFGRNFEKYKFLECGLLTNDCTFAPRCYRF